jgi:hypothetical protein
MSTKSKLLDQINKKAQKIRDKRVEAASNKSLESAVFEFFKNVEESRKLHNNERYDSTLFKQAQRALAERVNGFDRGTKISVEFNVPEDLTSWEEQTVRGVTIWWSKAYIAKNNVNPSYFIDISQMLFL